MRDLQVDVMKSLMNINQSGRKKIGNQVPCYLGDERRNKGRHEEVVF